jgi:hypothetical protein
MTRIQYYSFEDGISLSLSLSWSESECKRCIETYIPTFIFECGCILLPFSKIHLPKFIVLTLAIFYEHCISHVCTGGQELVAGRMDVTHLLCL